MGRTKRSIKHNSKTGRAFKKQKRKNHAKRNSLAKRHRSASLRRRKNRVLAKKK